MGMGVTMIKCFTWGAILAIGLQVGGCYTDFGPVIVEPEPIVQSRVATRLQTGERLKVTVYGEENLSGFYDINPAGFVALPLAGTVRAAGRTRLEVEREITRKYREFVQDPKVTVDVVAFRPFYVLGEVEKPGEYPYRSGLNVLTAVSTAGGFTYRARRDWVLIQRAGEDVWREYALSEPIPVLPGDLIRIPERYF
jgi:protein involved in polysaccharide export with SLBB domain